MESAGFGMYWVDSARQILDKEDLRLTMIVQDLLVIDMAELVRLQICDELGDTWASVASGLERQLVATAGSPEVDEGAPDVDKGA
ncbi:hypothetical protein Tco_0918574 [Tanacetum coccineum]